MSGPLAPQAPATLPNLSYVRTVCIWVLFYFKGGEGGRGVRKYYNVIEPAYVASLTKLQYTSACTSVPPPLYLRFLADFTVNNRTAMLLKSALVLCSSSLDFWHVCSKRFNKRRAVDLKVPRCCIRLFGCKIYATRLFWLSFCHFHAIRSLHPKIKRERGRGEGVKKQHIWGEAESLL